MKHKDGNSNRLAVCTFFDPHEAPFECLLKAGNNAAHEKRAPWLKLHIYQDAKHP